MGKKLSDEEIDAFIESEYKAKHSLFRLVLANGGYVRLIKEFDPNGYAIGSIRAVEFDFSVPENHTVKQWNDRCQRINDAIGVFTYREVIDHPEEPWRDIGAMAFRRPEDGSEIKMKWFSSWGKLLKHVERQVGRK